MKRVAPEIKSFLLLTYIPLAMSLPLSRQPRLSEVEWANYNFHEPQGPGTYAFGYDIEDPETNNIQFRDEERFPNGTVVGSYGFVKPDGDIHIVRYIADKNGYRYISGSGDSRSKQATDLREKMFPYPEVFSSHRRQISPVKSGSPSVVSLSKRPLQCPKADCNKFVSLFTLESHFKYEHKEVPIILTQLDARSALEFYPRDVRYGVTQCIVLLNVINHDFSNIIPQTSCYCSRTNLQTTDSKPVMVLLAARIAGSHLNQLDDSKTFVHSTCPTSYEDQEAEDDDDDEDDVGTISSRTYVETKHNTLSAGDKIIIWVASNIFTSLSYTVAASTLSNKIRQKYFGPMLTLGDNPMELCKEGTGLILTHFHVNGMSENGMKPLAIDVVIHSPD